MSDKEYQQQVAQTIIQQLGGFGRLKAMVNGRNYVSFGHDAILGHEQAVAGLKFQFSGSRKYSWCVISLDADDTYSLQFAAVRKYEWKPGKKMSGLYWDMLIPTFESETGLYLRI